MNPHARSTDRVSTKLTLSSYGHQSDHAIIRMADVKRLMLEAIADGEFYLEYQPQSNINGLNVVGVEALLRWHSPRYGCISPVDFIPLAEKFNLISEIGNIAIRKSCEQLAEWKQEYNTTLRMAINVSYMQVHSYSMLGIFESEMARHHLQPGDLEVELTESKLVSDKRLVVDILKQLRLMGIRTAIDDFGTGYSSLNHLANMPFDLLKIDKSFIGKLGINQANTTITRSIIDMAKGLEMEVLAEGVETQLQKQLLEDHACDLIQGNLISKPVSADKIPVITGMSVC